MPEPAEYRIAPDFAAERPCTIVAFDGDDTLWIDDTEEKRWERECKRLCVAGLPHPDMANAFHRHVSAFRYTQEGVQRALIESAREVCGGDVPAEWRADIDAIPGLVASLNLRFPHGLDHLVAPFDQIGSATPSVLATVFIANRPPDRSRTPAARSVFLGAQLRWPP